MFDLQHWKQERQDLKLQPGLRGGQGCYLCDRAWTGNASSSLFSSSLKRSQGETPLESYMRTTARAVLATPMGAETH